MDKVLDYHFPNYPMIDSTRMCTHPPPTTPSQPEGPSLASLKLLSINSNVNSLNLFAEVSISVGKKPRTNVGMKATNREPRAT